ncbi:single-stranded DNA-binding protein [Nakamurella sp. A5-74]|uniref:Single-stranded DNA-binding protein n=1 Tax=Nakamurella sp. A5-74 TaxID=3158264 RepID=A0AAU8DTB5_9ACTN
MRQQATAWVIGHVATPVETHGDGNAQRTKFRVLINSRYFDRNSQTWVEREATGTEVTCWGELARNVAGSVHLGDPVIVHGRLEENRWVDREGAKRKSVQLIAELVAHDLNRGTAAFAKSAAAVARSGIGDLDTEASHADGLDHDGILDPRAEPVPAGAPF